MVLHAAQPQNTGNTAVPLLDINRQNAPLWDEINDAMAAVCESGAFVHGPACHQFEIEIADYCGVAHAVGCASGSDALLLALMALGVEWGHEVIVPSFTFFATASAVTRLGAKPVFVDIVPETFNIDPQDLTRKISTRTKAIIPVHMFGQCAEMDEINELALQAGNIPVIEDAAQAIGAGYRGRRAGGLGRMGCFSFYPTKNLGAFGDGGMITTDDEELAERLRILRDHGQHPRYHHGQVGINSRLDALQAAVLSVKLKHLDDYAAGRRENAERYRQIFTECGLDTRLGLPQVAAGCDAVWNQFTIRVPDGQRDILQKHLSDHAIGSAVYYPIPLHHQACFKHLGFPSPSLPATEQACQEVVSLPVYEGLAQSEQNRVIQSIAKFFHVAADHAIAQSAA